MFGEPFELDWAKFRASWATLYIFLVRKKVMKQSVSSETQKILLSPALTVV